MEVGEVPSPSPRDGQPIKVLGEVEAFTGRIPAPGVGAFLPGDGGRGLPFFVVMRHDDGSEHTLDCSNDACAVRLRWGTDQEG